MDVPARLRLRITSGSDKHKQSISLTRVIIQSCNTSSSSASSYTSLQRWMIPHEQDFPPATSYCHGIRRSWKRAIQSTKCQLHQASLTLSRGAQSKFFLCPGDVIVVVGLCPPVAGTATLRPERSQRCTRSLLVLSEKQPKGVNEKKQQYFNTSFFVFSNNHSFEEGQKTLTILSACIHHLISNIHSRCTLDEVKQKCESID